MEGNRRSPYRNLQPRAAAAIDFNDSDDDDGLLSSDYKAQRKTTMDLVDFFKNAPPPPPPAPSLPPVAVEEKKKKTLLQRLRARKSSVSSNKDRSSVVSAQLPQGATSSISAISASSRGGEVATLPNGTKYVMIAVDYKSKDTDVVGGGKTIPSALPTSVSLPQGSPNRSNINSPVESKRNPILNNNPNLHMTTTVQEDNNKFSSNNDSSKGADRRRSIIIQAGGGEGSTFSLDNTPFLLDNFALNTDYITPSAKTDNIQDQRLPNSQSNSEVNGGHSRQGTENGSKRGNKVTFDIDGQHRTEATNDDTISRALAERVANHKAQLSSGMLSEATTITNHSSCQDQSNGPQVILPRPVSRKKVRHVQIQTQHCIMRPMYTQTEPIDSLNQDLEAREFGTQTSFGSNVDGFTDVGTSTDSDATAVSPTSDRLTSRVASLAVGATSTNTSSKSTSTTTTTSTAEATSTTPLTSQEREELTQLRQQNAALQAQVVSLQRDLAAETRARTRTAVAMQDTRDKFEMLSAMAYKKLKEMITNRHILEMEVRELRAQMDMHAEEGEMYSQQQGQQGYITVGLRY